ncbi:MAG: DUF3883 domain-containing protein, partial [Anaerolineae bacterium]|nr:DUF3883 domain-containing protein [Anaerolineae bacterium]
GLVKRVMIITPASLTFQWQRELKDKFRENFEIIRSDVLRANYGSNPWQEKDQVITSVSWVSRVEDAKESLLRSQWDLIIVDEAHKMSAYSSEKKTLAYQLGESLGAMTDHYLLMTATPHKGDPKNFCLFLNLLDRDVYGDISSLEDAMERHEAPFYLRRVKEALVTFPEPETGHVKALFTRRHVTTTEFQISEEELDFYDRLTRYVEDQSIKAASDDSARGRALAFTMAMLQRRFASSLYAVRRSLERMRDKRERILKDPAGYRKEQLNKRLPEDFEDLTDEEQQDIISELEDVVADVDPVALREEISELSKLISHARELEAREIETKLVALKELLTTQGVFADPKMKLLVFTEHKDTLDYLAGDGRDGRPMGKLREWGLSLTQIHGGMKIGDRDSPGTRIFAERDFRESAQVLVATEAAGEGINLQFCWLMINYDIPWNPVRLEQRMGRIHRYGQEKDCLIFNFVASNTVEGHVLQTLLAKLEDIRKSLGDRVFDVIGMMLKTSDFDLEEILREAAYNPRSISDEYYVQQIERINPDRLRELEQATGVAMATSHVDLGRIQAQDYRSEERRLMPEYVEQYFLTAAEVVGLRIEQRADTLYRVEHVPQKFRATTLNSVKRFGPPGSNYRKLTFNKHDILHNSNHGDAELVSPGHPLFAAVSEVLATQLADARGGLALYVDPLTAEAYRLHFFVAELVGEEPVAGSYRTVTQHASMCVILETAQGDYEMAPPDVLHDLQPLDQTEETPAVDPTVRQRLERYVQRTFQRSLLDEQRTRREHEINIRHDYLERTFESLLNALQRKYWDLSDKADTKPQYRIARDEALRRIDDVEAKQTQKLEALKHLRVLRPGAVRYLGSAEVRPADMTASAYAAMHSDPEVERRAMEIVMAHERERGWTPMDISQLHDGSGFDIRSVGPSDAYGKRPVRRIEVKGRSGYDQPVVMTTNEWLQATRHGETYWLYVVWGCGQGQTPRLLEPIQNPATRLAQTAQPIIKHYLIPASAINEA